MNDAERWLPIAGYEGVYDVSDLGRVRSWSRFKRGATLKPLPNKQGYMSVCLQVAGKAKYRKIHQLVLEAFVGERPDGQIVRHLDGDVSNNAVGNLAWGTYSENMADAVRHGTHNEARKTQCSAGHEYSPENTVVRRNGKRRCRECQRDRAGYKGGLPMQERTHCPQGHEYSPENTEVKCGGRRCKTCRKAYDRARSARRSEERARRRLGK